MKKILVFLLLGSVILSCKEKIPVPVAKFVFSVQTKGEVTFTNQSTDANTYQWDFGDGTGKSSELNPQYVYQQPGRYTVTLKATGAGGEAQVQNTVEIVALKPTASFNFTILPGGEVQFTNDSKDGVSYAWTFEGVGNSTFKDPKISFIYNDTFKVTLKVTGFGGVTEELTKTVTITNGKERPPVIDFAVKDLGQGKIQFTNNSKYGVSYSWAFGDGGISTEANPSYTYLFNGTYKVSLCATNKSGETVCKEVSSVVTGIAPIKIFEDASTGYAASYTVESGRLMVYITGKGQLYPSFGVDVNQNKKVDPNVDRKYGTVESTAPDGTKSRVLCRQYLLNNNSSTSCGGAPSNGSFTLDNVQYNFSIPLTELADADKGKQVSLYIQIYNLATDIISVYPKKGQFANDFENTYFLQVKR